MGWRRSSPTMKNIWSRAAAIGRSRKNRKRSAPSWLNGVEGGSGEAHPGLVILRCSPTSASLEGCGDKCKWLILRGAQVRAPQDDGVCVADKAGETIAM